MIRKLPIISPCATPEDILRALSSKDTPSAANTFKGMIASSTGARKTFLADSGISSCYIILKALRSLSGKKEVILPAYTAGSLVVAVRKAGLKPVLCDISLSDFNYDEELLAAAISRDTLAVTCVHLFGINAKGIAALKAKMPQGVFLIEDCAQSMGSCTGDGESGSFGDVSFFSFNRGKNLPLYGGGCIVTDNGEIAGAVEREQAYLAGEGLFSRLGSLLKIIAFFASGNPVIYGVGFPFRSSFKETRPPEDFTPKVMGSFQTALGCELMRRREDIFSARHSNGMALINALKAEPALILPQIPPGTRYVFNRSAVIFKNIKDRIKAEEMLRQDGIEASRMYIRPLHRMFDMGYAAGDFPKAAYCAERILTLPVHPAVGAKETARMVDAIKESLK